MTMNPTLIKILKSREDISDYLFHFTKGSKGKDTLSKILLDGSLKDIHENGYICFTDSPITMLPSMFEIFDHYDEPMYAPYGIGFRKELLYDFGCRPVIYDDKDGLSKLPMELRWRGVEYVPGKYDYSWLREWRIHKSEVPFSDNDIIVIGNESEEVFDLTYDLDDIDFDGDVEEGRTQFLGFAEGHFTRKYKGISLEDISTVNRMTKSELEEFLGEQNQGDQDGRSLGMFMYNI